MFFYTDDPVGDWDRYCMEQEREMQNCPICTECGDYITDESMYCVDGKCYHIDCFESEYRVYNR